MKFHALLAQAESLENRLKSVAGCRLTVHGFKNGLRLTVYGLKVVAGLQFTVNGKRK